MAAILVLAVGAWGVFGGGIRFPAAVTQVTDGPTTHTVSVSGTGRVFLTPDLAEVRLGVLVQRSTVGAARDAAATAMNGLIDALRKVGIRDADIKTSTLSLQPIYETKSDGTAPRIVGYELRNGVIATIRNLELVGPAVDGAVAGGATTIEGIIFRVADSTAAERQAREAAVLDARQKADTLVRAAGTRITGVISISESMVSPPWTSRTAAAESPGTPILPGTTEVDVSVSIVYELE